MLVLNLKYVNYKLQLIEKLSKLNALKSAKLTLLTELGTVLS